MSWLRAKTYGLEARQTLRLAGPIIFNQIGQVLIGVTDSVMIGRLGAVPLAASAFAISIFHFFLIFGLGICASISPLVAHAHGAKRDEECGELLRHGVIIGVVSALLLALFIHFSLELLPVFGQPEAVTREAEGFLWIIGWSLLPLLAFQCFRQFSEGLSHTLSPMVITLAALIVNVFLNWVLIYGHLGMPAMGLMGAGWANLITRVGMVIAMIWVVVASKDFSGYRPRRWWAPLQGRLFAELLRLGLPSGFQYLFEVGAFAGAAIMMGWIDTTTLAAHQIALNLASLTFMFALGISFATSIRIGHAIGRNDLTAARRVGFSAIILAGLVQGLCGVVFFLGRHSFPSFYIHDPAVIEISSVLLIIAGVFQVFDGIQGVGVGALRGMKDVAFPTLITFTSYWAISLPLGYLLAFSFQLAGAGIWVGLLVGLIFSATLLSLRLHLITRIVPATLASSPAMLRDTAS